MFYFFSINHLILRDDNTEGANDDDNNVNNQHYHEINQCVNGQNTRERLSIIMK